MKIDQMDLRQIDVLIAEWIGCKVVDPGSAIPRCACPHYPHSVELCDDLKRYSGDIVSAMEVVEEMRVYGFSWTASQPSGPPSEGEIVFFTCRFWPCENHEIKAETLPLAICKAALLALGKENGQEKA